MRPDVRHTGGSRANALWGRGGRRVGALSAALSSALLFAAVAAGAPTKAPAGPKLRAYVPEALVSAILQNPRGQFDVIVQGERKGRSAGLFTKALQDAAADGQAIDRKQIRRQFAAINGGRATLSGRQILALGTSKSVTAIMANEPVAKSDVDLPLTNVQKQLWSAKAPVNWTASALSATAPTIAIVDSGIDATRPDFAGRVLGQVDVASLAPNSPGDGHGHGTFVASVAAGSAAGHAGVAPTANLLAVDVLNDAGAATVADVVAAADWILANKSAYNIKVANFSLHATNQASIFFDPIDQAVERLWLNGVVVVAAAGNYAVDGKQSNVPFAPGNDPFVITVGATDILNTVPSDDDVAAPWSAWGYTHDGFVKPDLAAPGRYVVGAVPPTATLALERPDHLVGDDYMQLSGTSFSAPAVAGAAAVLLAQHPDWTPDQVKGALMVSAQALPAATPLSVGVGGLDVAAAEAVQSPPNPNAALNQFVVADASGAPVFDTDAWQSAASSDAAWSSAAWSDAAWSDAAWSSAAWSDAAWSDAAWSDAAWGSAAWGSAAWSDAAWSDAAWSDAAWADAAPFSAAIDASLDSPITPEEMQAVLVALGLA